MKLLIIGHSVEDHIHSSGSSTVQPGGIYYTASALSSVMSDGDEIFICSSIEENNYNLFAGVYDKLNKKFLQKTEGISKVHLNIYENKEREEKYENLGNNLVIPSEDLNSFDGILINMISGFDISLEQLKKLRINYKGIIYFDVHTLSRGVGEHLHRHFRIIPDFNEWAANVDLIQANKHELHSLGKYENEFFAVKSLLKKEDQTLIVTKDELGARLYSMNRKEIISVFKAAINIKTNNKIGCGDVFGAIFFYTYIKNRDLYNSIAEANMAAGLAASYADINELEKLSEGMALFRK